MSDKHFPNPLQIGLGEGRVGIRNFHDHSRGVHGIIMMDTGQPHEVGDFDADNPPHENHVPQTGEVYVACLNRKSALVLLDAVLAVVDAFPE